ncbi:ciliary microtubule inner protein 5 [Denticeps clupeoides]|uniref:Uncharacterized protein n=1 Tax=Denticeps clupeoides TaxID=299321 RepID=A0AAY3ZVI8_9TELE|nr:uncharacterized protein C2orf50 homolog [Denticeps clupeoides]
MERSGEPGRATSAGYRLKERPSGPLASQSAAAVSRQRPPGSGHGGSGSGSGDAADPVTRDQVWREFVRAERAGVKGWERNWSFLKTYNQLGQPRTESPLPACESAYSQCRPNTTNQIFGSRLCTELGKELVRMDKLLLLTTGGHYKTKQSPEMQPC